MRCIISNTGSWSKKSGVHDFLLCPRFLCVEGMRLFAACMFVAGFVDDVFWSCVGAFVVGGGCGVRSCENIVKVFLEMIRKAGAKVGSA